mgnify:CR=1 FL=1
MPRRAVFRQNLETSQPATTGLAERTLAGAQALWPLAVVLVLTSLVSYWYYLRMAWYMWFREPAEGTVLEPLDGQPDRATHPAPPAPDGEQQRPRRLSHARLHAGARARRNESVVDSYRP